MSCVDNVKNAPFVEEMKKMTANMYRLGWDERNGGNISLMVDESEALKYIDPAKVIRTIPTGFDATPLIGQYFLVTGTGKYFKNVMAPAFWSPCYLCAFCSLLADA